MFDPELTAFLESGCSTIVGFVTVTGEPFASRGWGTKVEPGTPVRIRLLVSAAAVRALGLAPPFAIAVTGADVRTLRSVQLKGTATAIEQVDDDDLARSTRFCEAFFGDVADVDGIEPELMQRLVPADLLACTIEVAEAYDQTPGPAAGKPLVQAPT